MLNINFPDKELEDRFFKLVNMFKNYKSVTVAFSGGIDSTLLAFIAKEVLGRESAAVTVNSEFITRQELDATVELSRELGLNHKVINLSIFVDEITDNHPERCKVCKEFIFSEIIKNSEFKTIIEGSNLDDLEDYRPGMLAIKALDVKSPFIETEISKSDIRTIARLLGLSNWDKPAMACLASRIPYGTKITKEILVQVKEAENFIQEELGYKGSRVRHHDNIARIELNPENINNFIKNDKDKVDKELKKLGYKYVCLELSGYSKGSLNREIKE